MKNKILIWGCIFFFNTSSLLAQADSAFWNKDMRKIATISSQQDWINIRKDTILDPNTFFAKNKRALNLSVNDEMRLYKTETDNIGFTHYRYNQYYKGYKVFAGEYILHARDGKLEVANGKLVKELKKDPVINLSEKAALQKALQYFSAKTYAWQVPQIEKDYKNRMHDATATFKPRGELVWVSKNFNAATKDISTYELAYVFDIYPASLEGGKIFVSAADGHIITSLPLTSDCTAASVTTNFYGSQIFYTRFINGSVDKYNLWNDCQTAFVHTRKWLTDSTSTEYISGADNDWTTMSSAATSHWATQKAYDYFLKIHGRSGWDNKNAGVNIFQDALFCSGVGCIPNSSENASMSFSSGVMRIGNSGTTSVIDDWNTLDIIAHEFSHAVTGNSARLLYSKESGALNESFSDIFGVSCYQWLFGWNSNIWKIGFDRKAPNTTVSLYYRNMQNPNDKSDPDTYLTGEFWQNEKDSSDNFGVHNNSGVQNFMYYLLVSGGKGINANKLSYSLLGIGIVAARDIAYRALTQYLTSFSTYPDARNAWVRAAVDLYGECSFQAIETGKAWDAVGLPPPVNSQVTFECGVYGTSVYSVVRPSIFSLSFVCAMSIVPSSLVEFGANKVILNPGFKAVEGSRFRAYVSDCRFATY